MTDAPVNRDMAFQAMAKAVEAAAEIAKHEAVCAERYLNTEKTLNSIQGLIRWVGVTSIAAIISLGIWGIEQAIMSAQAKGEASAAAFAAINNRIGALANATNAARPTTYVVNTPPAPAPAAPAAPANPYGATEPGQAAQ